MKTIELTSRTVSLPELLRIAHREPVLIRTPSGDEYVLGAVDTFEREVALMRLSPDLQALLAERRKEPGTVPLDSVRKQLA
jgi:hypothetical protein